MLRDIIAIILPRDLIIFLVVIRAVHYAPHQHRRPHPIAANRPDRVILRRRRRRVINIDPPHPPHVRPTVGAMAALIPAAFPPLQVRQFRKHREVGMRIYVCALLVQDGLAMDVLYVGDNRDGGDGGFLVAASSAGRRGAHDVQKARSKKRRR